jgi:hypothetical protein
MHLLGTTSQTTRHDACDSRSDEERSRTLTGKAAYVLEHVLRLALRQTRAQRPRPVRELTSEVSHRALGRAVSDHVVQLAAELVKLRGQRLHLRA